MSPRRLTCLVAALAVTGSCTSRDSSGGGSDTTAASDSVASESAVPWFDGAAPLLLAPADSAGHALVVLADSMASDLEDGAMTRPAWLVRLDGAAMQVTVSVSSTSEGCVDAALRPAPAQAWGVGFVGVAPTGLPVDSLRSIARGDSAALAPVAFRMSSGIPNLPGGRFNGLPFTLIDMWRVRLPSGKSLLVAATKRQINQEDSPLEERTIIVAKADSAGDYALAYSARSSGPEETVEGIDLLAALTVPGAGPLLVFSHNFGDETSYSILEPAGSQWKARWSSRRFSC